MVKEYLGENSKTLYAKVMIKKEITIITYLLLATAFLAMILFLSIKQAIINESFKIVFYVVSFLVGYIILNLIGFIIAYVVRVIKNFILIKGYKIKPLINVMEVIIDYDYKLWQTAAINSVHPLSFKLHDNNEVIKTAIIFTNHSSYGLFPKFSMPNILRAKNYINHKALVGYDENHKEWIIIKYI